MTTRRLSALALAAFTSSVLASAAPGQDLAPAAQDALQSWRAQHGSNWSVFVDEETGRAELLYGGNVEANFAPRTDADWFLRARVALEQAHELTGISAASLDDREVIALPLAHLGTTDKLTVSFEQRVDGLSVEGARVNLLFDSEARLLSIHSTALPGEEFSVLPAQLTAAAAELRARELFEERKQLTATRTNEPELVIVQVQSGSTRLPRAAWRTELMWEQAGTTPQGETLWIDAADGQLLRAANLVHHVDVGGTVSSMATPGLAPDSGSNPEQSHTMRHLRVSSSQGTTDTDANGFFNFPGVNGPLQVTFSYAGDFASVNNSGGSEYSTTPSLSSGTNNSVLMNSGSQSSVTAQANAFYHINLLRDWVRSINPSDGHADFTANANVNINDSCNAFYNGSSVNFFTPGGSCVNTAYSTIVAHEMGHWLNVRYATGNGPDGMGEGNADVWAMYLYDTPVVGEGFSGGGAIRSGLNTLQFCGDFVSACHGGEVHREGEVWMGAAWKIRDALNQSLGNSLGDDVANALFLGWMASFNQTEIASIIETQWILLDDDDGDINNGSPHYAELETGFAAQGWPGVALHALTIEDVSVPADSLSESGPYDAQLAIIPHFGQSLTSTQIHYRVNGGAWQDFDLAPLPDFRFAALLPDVSSPAAIEMWFSGSDSLGNNISWPEAGVASPASFVVGAPSVFLTESFENSPAGWTSGSYGDTSNSANEWEHGVPQGKDGTIFDGGTTAIHWRDPTAGSNGFDAWAIDLGTAGDGRYGNDTHSWLRSVPFDCTGRTGTRLRFQRWASVHRADELSIRVNGTTVWTSGNEDHVLDSEWTEVEYDISGLADNQPAVVVEFEMRSNSAYRLGGWQLDQFQLLEFGPSPAGCTAPVGFGPAKPSSTLEFPVLSATGSPSPGGNFKIHLQQAALNQPCVMFSGGTWALIPFGNAYRLVGAPIVREANTTASSVGNADFPINVTGAMVGSTLYYQVWFRDPLQSDGTGLGLSTGLRVNYCP